VRKVSDGLDGVVHSKAHSRRLEVENFELGGLAALSGGVDELELSGLGDDDVGSSVLMVASCLVRGPDPKPQSAILQSPHLITVSVSSDDDWLGPSWDGLGDFLDHDWLSEDSSSKNVSDGAVGRLPLWLWCH